MDGRVEPAVVDAQRHEVDLLACHRAGVDGAVLLLDVVREFGPIVATVGFGEDAEIAVFVPWELRVECLQQLPDVRCGGDGRCYRVSAVGEADTNGLVDVQHVCVLVEAVWIE